jgi:hypothetical protein
MLGQFLRSDPNKVYRLTCRWKKFPLTEHKIYLCIVRILKVKELVDEVCSRTPFNSDYTRKMVLKMFGGDDDLTMSNFRESLTCPVSYFNSILFISSILSV